VAWRHDNQSSYRNAMADCALVTIDRDEDIRGSDIVAAFVVII